MLGPQMEGCVDICPVPSIKARTAQANPPPPHTHTTFYMSCEMRGIFQLLRHFRSACVGFSSPYEKFTLKQRKSHNTLVNAKYINSEYSFLIREF